MTGSKVEVDHHTILSLGQHTERSLELSVFKQATTVFVFVFVSTEPLIMNKITTLKLKL